MTLQEHIEDIRNKLKEGQFTNEATVSDDIVRRLLHDPLGWPRYEPQIVYPQYSVEGGRVDFALCNPPSEPRVFIEVKQVEKIKGAEEQLFRYAFQRGVPIAILTDGREWQFFHPAGEGTWAERKVCELDLITGDSGENAERFHRYLNYESIRTDEAIEAIKKDYEMLVQQRQVATRLPEAWSKLVEEADEFLVHTVAEKTESLSGYKPTDEQVLSFLRDLERKTELDRRETSPPSVPSAQSAQPRTRRAQKAPQTRLVVTMPNEEVVEHPTATNTWIEVILKLGPDRVLEVDQGQVISTSPNFRPGRPEVQHGRYYIAKDYSTRDKKRLLEKIASRLGVWLKVEIVDK